MRIYLDNCCYNRPYDDQSQMRVFLESQAKLHIQDYTKWRRTLFGDASVEEINEAAAAYDAAHPFHPKKKQVTI